MAVEEVTRDNTATCLICGARLAAADEFSQALHVVTAHPWEFFLHPGVRDRLFVAARELGERAAAGLGFGR